MLENSLLNYLTTLSNARLNGVDVR